MNRLVYRYLVSVVVTILFLITASLVITDFIYYHRHSNNKVISHHHNDNKNNDNFYEACRLFWKEANCSSKLLLNSESQSATNKQRHRNHRWPDNVKLSPSPEDKFNFTRRDTNKKNRRYSNYNYQQHQHKIIDFRRVLLVVYFNSPHYESASKIDALYRRAFAEIVYCGPSSIDEFWPLHQDVATSMAMLALPRVSTHYVNYSMPTRDTGQTTYNCLPQAMALLGSDYTDQLDGILVMADDVVPNLWTFSARNKSLDKNWLMTDQNYLAFDIDTGYFCLGESSHNTEDCRADVGSYWVWASRYADKLASFYDELFRLAEVEGKEEAEKEGGAANSASYNITNTESSNDNLFWQRVYDNLVKKTRGSRRVLGRSGADLFYVSQRYLSSVGPVMQLLAKHDVYLEISVITALRIAADDDDDDDDDLQWIDMAGHDYGDGHLRNLSIVDAYSTQFEMFHPFKLSHVKHLDSILLLDDSNNDDKFQNNDNFISNQMAAIKQQGNFQSPNVDLVGVGMDDDDSAATCVYCNIFAISNSYAEAQIGPNFNIENAINK